jgi:hypothetical protein
VYKFVVYDCYNCTVERDYLLYPIGRESGIYASHDIALVLEVINDNYILSTEALSLVHLNTLLWLAM